jgi:hypothetical protein
MMVSGPKIDNILLDIISVMKLTENAHLVPPTFESIRDNNEFTSRLFLHHFQRKGGKRLIMLQAMG